MPPNEAPWQKRARTLGIDPLDALVLLAWATGLDKAFLLAHPEYVLPEETSRKFEEALEKRSEHVPVAYITGEKEFFGHLFRVSPAVLIPRPETEILIEATLESVPLLADRAKRLVFVDVGTGSGAIIISLAAALGPHENFAYVATDRSERALALAKENAAQIVPETPIAFFSGDLLEPVLSELEALGSETHLVILANLPYVSETLYRKAPEDVRAYEPREALVSGIHGLDLYQRLFRSLRELPVPFSLFVEFSPEQAALLEASARESFPHARTRVREDLAGRPRVLTLERE
jgi:release factor glutamine methyltransferase